MKDDFEHSRGRGVSTEIWIAAAPQRLFFKDEMLQSACPPFGTKQTLRGSVRMSAFDAVDGSSTGT
jgi:hypothetical protein